MHQREESGIYPILSVWLILHQLFMIVWMFWKEKWIQFEGILFEESGSQLVAGECYLESLSSFSFLCIPSSSFFLFLFFPLSFFLDSNCITTYWCKVCVVCEHESQIFTNQSLSLPFPSFTFSWRKMQMVIEWNHLLYHFHSK